MSPDWPPDMCPSTPLISALIESEQMAAVTEPIHSNNRAREDDEVWPRHRGDDTAMTRARSGNGSALFTFLHRAAVDICCLRVCGKRSLLSLLT